MKKIILLLGVIVLVSCSKKEEYSYPEKAVDSADVVAISETEEKESINEEKKQEEDNSKYIDNSLETGATPYAKYYGGNKNCKHNGCSQIKVTTSGSDVLVIIKEGDKVVRHAYVRGNDEYTFSFPNGTYQAFFYYGKGWNPEKPMKNGEIRGGFVENEDFQKDDPQSLHNNILEYQLILQQNGNFNTQSSNSSEAL